MLTFKLFEAGLYLSEADVVNPSAARAGFMFQDGSRTDPSFDLTAASWADPNSQGYFCFFVPSPTRKWAAFAVNARQAFQGNPGSQFAFFTDDNAGAVNAVTMLLVSGQGSGSAALEGTAAFTSRNVTVQITPSPFSPATIGWDDANNQFIINISGPSPAAQLTFTPVIGGGAQPFPATSSQLLLPMTGGAAGTINFTIQIAPTALDYFEAGMMYFAPPETSGGELTALRFPLLRGPGGSDAALNFSLWFDVLNATDCQRTYLQATDPVLGSYLAAANGKIFALKTNQTGAVSTLSRLVFSSRPQSAISDTANYYLAPAGVFSLALDAASVSAEAGPDTAILLCGITGTEFFEASVAAGSPDTLTFVPGQPAYASGIGGDTQAQLTDSGGNTVTSWAHFTTRQGSYVSQPEQGPLFQQPSNARVSLNAANPEANAAHLLDFYPLAAWQPNSTTPVSSPAVPLAAYAGIPASVDLGPFRAMETSALNPTRKNAMTAAPHATARLLAANANGGTTLAMTPQGLLSVLTTDKPPVWTGLQMAQSPSGILQFSEMGPVIRTALNQNRIFAVISTLTGRDSKALFSFADPDDEIDISDWVFSLSPAGTPDVSQTPHVPPIVIFKFYDGQSLEDLVGNMTLWSSPDDLNTGKFTKSDAQNYIHGLIADAKKAVKKDRNSLYASFVTAVTDPNFAGILALNCNLVLNDLPPAIQAVLGGMTKQVNGQTVSNVDAFRAHHVGIQINDTDPTKPAPSISQSSLFALVDYEKPAPVTGTAQANSVDPVPLGFEVEYLRALFTNSELRSFACQLNLTINKLFDAAVNLGTDGALTAAGAADKNVIQIQGSYQNHSSGSSEGEGVYSFVTTHSFVFNFAGSQYLDNITLDKLQFSFSRSASTDGGKTIQIAARFAIWGSMKFKQLNVLDIFSFDSLAFADLGITVGFKLQLSSPPVTSGLTPTFSPGDLRLDLNATKPRAGSQSLLALLPFRLKSFLYSQNADQTLESLNYFRLTAVEGLGINVADKFNYALLFDLDLGSMGALVGSLSAFKFSFLIGWLSGDQGGVAFGVQMPEADGKLEIKIQGVIDLLIQEFQLLYYTPKNGDPQMLVVVMHNTTITILGNRMPPSGYVDFALFKPSSGNAQIGWIVAYNNEGSKAPQLEASIGPEGASALADKPQVSGNGVLDVKYFGLGQRVGPKPTSPPTNFADFLKFMTTGFWTAVSNKNYSDVYHPDGGWIAVTDLKILKIVQLGIVFYDVTPFYSLTLNVENMFNFEITYTKVTDTIGLYYADLSLPNSLRTFQAGAASVTLPSVAVSVYTNGNWKVDLGFPQGDDWSRCFQIQCMAGPVPVTGAGGFYIASLSSATDNIFVQQYSSILAFGLACRLGVGKDFTSGPLSAGVSITFFGIIEGATGYLLPSTTGTPTIFRKPDALMLSGQFGLIGQIYGSIDFKIIKASINVTLSASIGIILHLESGSSGYDGSILLYVTASVSVSVSVSIDLGLFSISISFSFDATFRFQWTLLNSGSSSQAVAMLAASVTALAASNPAAIPILPGLNPALTIWFLPEVTVAFADTQNAGTPYFVLSLCIPFTQTWKSTPTYADFTPFEALTAQMVTWALMESTLQVPAYNAPVAKADLSAIDQTPQNLVDFLNYNLLEQQLAVFTGSQVSVLNGTAGATYPATTFPMPPFMQFATTGRLDGNNNPADLNYVFSVNNLVSQSYLDQVDQYLNQLFVNRSQGGAPQLKAAATAATIPLTQQIFLEYFTGLIRSGVHQLLQTMEDAGQQSENLDQLICAAVGAGRFASLAGQMASIFRGGARMPYTPGLTVPAGGTVDTSTNPLYSLLWQQFPVGQLSPVKGGGKNDPTSQYTVQLTQPDTTQSWLTSSVNYALTNLRVDPFTGLTSSQVSLPTAPALIPFTSMGPQSFSFGTQTTWTQPSGSASLRPLPPAMLQLTNIESGPTGMVVMSRQAGSAYLPGGNPVAANSFQWATSIQLIVKQIPLTSGGKGFIPNTYALSGASQADQKTLQAILNVLKSSNPIASIQVLYQTTAGASGLNSATINPATVFLLRTNTTTVSAPPVQMLLAAMATVDSGVAVGAQIDDATGFLQILEQASVTNAPGYYLYYKDAGGHDLPADLFLKGPVAPLTIVITYNADGSQNTQASPAQVQPYYNTLVLDSPVANSVYYAETVDPSLNVQYAAVAPGAVGAQLTRSQSPALLAAKGGAMHTHAEFMAAAAQAGVKAEHEMRRMLEAAGAAPAQLNALYSLLSYQVAATAGAFIQSNLSAPLQPQAPAGSSSTAPRQYRAFVPLYALAVANQSLKPGVPPNRYASLCAACDVNFYLNDCFGNQLPNQLDFTHNNLYFDSIVPVDQWQGIVASYDFSSGAANTMDITLAPSQTAFSGMSKDQAAAALAHYFTIYNQITGQGASFWAASNLSLNSSGVPASVTIDQTQQGNIAGLVQAIMGYLAQIAGGATNPPWTLPAKIVVSVALPATAAALPAAFGVNVQFGIARSMSLIDPSLFTNGVLTFPSAQSVSSSVSPNATTAQGSLVPFATAFAKAFPALALTVGLNGAQNTPASQSARRQKAQRTARKLLAAPADPAASAGASTPSLWAISQSLLNVTINSSTGLPLYSSPTPLRNSLESGTVPMPQMPDGIAQLPATQTFVDVDLDVYNRSFFTAVDQVLGPASAAAIFMANQAAYTAIAVGREHLATGFSQHEMDWLFSPQSPFTGSPDALKSARTAFEQQLRAALASAYTVDTVVQFPVQWNAALPSGAAGQISLFGQVQPAGATQGNYAGLSTAQIEVPEAGGPGLLTFLYSAPDAANAEEVQIELQLNLSHVQVFTEPASATPADEARPSLWLQLITGPQGSGLPANLIPIGPSGSKTIIPVVFRQYPTPPTIIAQAGLQGGSSQENPCSFSNALTQAAAWHYTLQYQAQLISQDQLIAAVTYNTTVPSSQARLRTNAVLPTQYTLFQALCRFSAAFPILQPILNEPASQYFSAAAGAFASLATDVTGNSDWNPSLHAMAVGAQKQMVTDQYTITDKASDSNRVITLTWQGKESSFTGATLSVIALGPDLTPYPNQQAGTVPSGITDTYQPQPAVIEDWVTHQIEVDCLNVLAAENARPGIQIERNLITLNDTQGHSWSTQTEFVYMTPFVEATQPVTPLLDITSAIDVAQLPGQGASKTCPQSPSSLCQRIATILYDLLASPQQSAIRVAASGDNATTYRLKAGCGFSYPVNSAANLPPGVNPISPLVPIVLARSFDIDTSVDGQIDAFATAFASTISSWAAANAIVFGSSPQPVGGQLIFDITLFAQLSGNTRPLLRLRNLQLGLSDVDPA